VIDTHAHLDACDGDVAGLLVRARVVGVTRVVAVGTGIQSCRDTLSICEREDGVYAALGLHPHDAAGTNEQDLAELRELLAHPKAVAVGETGLDHFRDYAPHDAQLRLFQAQTELAADLGKPLVIHSRAADAETTAVLTELPADLHVILHCFSSAGLLEPALERRWYISFAGNVTYPKATDLRAAAARVPADRLLAETDSPYLSPQPVRGRQNEPAHVTHTVATLADARNQDRSDLEAVIDRNATVAFRLP
jgi:TatD DNase family protein